MPAVTLVFDPHWLAFNVVVRDRYRLWQFKLRISILAPVARRRDGVRVNSLVTQI